jgi:hypothetical protein
MLHDSLTPAEAVDSEAALEFMKEATKLATASELEDIGHRLEVKRGVVSELLAPESLPGLDEAGLKRLLATIFSLRRKAGRLLAANGLDRLRAELAALLHGDGAVGGRLERFVEQVGGLESPMIVALATECLHFSAPQKHWLWTHWIWNPDTGSGALPLVTRDEIDLGADSLAASYLNVGRATALVTAQGRTDGWTWTGRGLFGTDVFLACVYAVYMYTVFRVRLSQEFNRILPELPELVQRVLGVRHLGGEYGR